MRVPNTPAPRRGPPPPRRLQHSRKCRTPHTPKASERAAGALPFAAPQGRRQGSQRLRTGPLGPARGRRRTDSRRFAASSRRSRKAKRGSLPPHCLHRRLLRSRGLLLPHGAALHALHGLRLLAAYKYAPGSTKIMTSVKKETIFEYFPYYNEENYMYDQEHHVGPTALCRTNSMM